jgi:ribonuclease D
VLGASQANLEAARVRRPKGTPDVTLIERQAQLTELCSQCRAGGRFAFDTEFVMEDRYESELCLVQIATERSVAVIDPFLRLDLSPLWELVADTRVETVLHAGQEDLALAVQHSGSVPKRVFDLQLAAGLVGFDYPISLQKLVQATLHVRVHKTRTLTDWRKRPLTASHIRYGAEDVQYLLVIRERLHQRLSELNRLDWAREEFARFEDMSLYHRAEEDKLRRVKGAGALSGQQLAILRELLDWRERRARKYNRPARTVLKDHLLVEIARHALKSFEEIRDLRGINLSDADVRRICTTVHKAHSLPPAKWPATRPREVETPREAILVALATAVVRTYCMEHDLAYGLVATQRSIRELIRHRTVNQHTDAKNVELLNGWRGQTVGVSLDEVLAGRRTVRVEPLNGELAVHITPDESG